MNMFKELMERNKKINEEITELKLLAVDAFKKINLNYADNRFYEKLYHAGIYKEEIIYNIKRMTVGSKKLNRAIDKLIKLKIHDGKMSKIEKLKKKERAAWEAYDEERARLKTWIAWKALREKLREAQNEQD